MGGDGSGRPKNPENMFKKPLVHPSVAQPGNITLPPTIHLKDSAKKSETFTQGSVVFVGSNGDFTEDNSNLFWDDTNNRLGIGTTSPAGQITIYRDNSSAGSVSQLTLEQDGSGDSSMLFLLTGTRAWQMGIDNDDSDKFKLGYAQSTTWDSNALTIDTTGKVGIGTASPQSLLHVSDGDIRLDNTQELLFEDSGGVADNSIRMASDDKLQIRTGATDRITIDTSGNVGINSTSPNGKLHVRQDGTTGAIPTLSLLQSDVSEEFVRFTGTSASGVLTQSLVVEADVSTATRAGFLKVFVNDDGNQITDQAYFIPIYTLA